ncbi:MAG: hypothetical protein C4519_11000, partial [Desulfobacteraceae bacterium]
MPAITSIIAGRQQRLIRLKMDLFDDFRSLLRQVDVIFHKVQAEFPAEVRCRPGCTDCCRACFDVSLVEAAYLRLHWQKLPSETQQEIATRAGLASAEWRRHCAELPRAGSSRAAIATWRIACPLLADEGSCALYSHRPITCRVYGLPTVFDGSGHVCGFSGFDPGRSYPTVKLD